MKFTRRLVHHSLDVTEVFAATALDHVGADGPRTARKPDQRHAAAQFAADECHRIDHVPEFPAGIRHAEGVDVRRPAHRTLDPGSFARFERQADVHGVRNGEDVGKQDRSIQRKSLERLQGDLAGELWIRAERQEITGARARRPIFRQVPAGLAHQPDGPPRRGLAQQGAQQQIVFQKVCHVLSLGSNSRRCSRMA